MKGKLRKKLKSPRGESLAEVLAAVLISAMAMVILAGMISTSGRLTEESKDRMDRYLAQENALEAQAGGGTAGTATIADKDGAAIRLTDGSAEKLAVEYYENQEAAGKTVVSYKLKGSGA